MQPQLPRIPVRLHHLRLSREIRIIPILHVPLPHERLEIAPELHAVRRIDVDHLHLPAHPLVLQQRVHHDE